MDAEVAEVRYLCLAHPQRHLNTVQTTTTTLTIGEKFKTASSNLAKWFVLLSLGLAHLTVMHAGRRAGASSTCTTHRASYTAPYVHHAPCAVRAASASHIVRRIHAPYLLQLTFCFHGLASASASGPAFTPTHPSVLMRGQCRHMRSTPTYEVNAVAFFLQH